MNQSINQSINQAASKSDLHLSQIELNLPVDLALPFDDLLPIVSIAILAFASILAELILAVVLDASLLILKFRSEIHVDVVNYMHAHEKSFQNRCDRARR